MNLKTFDSEKEFNEVTEKLYNYVLIRDNFLCQYCGGPGDELHHILFRSQQGKNKANNLITLCIECHRGHNGIHGRGKDLKKEFMKKVFLNERKLRKEMI